jgi:beta-lactamase regulating signal transducer with metallopeptidase domain
MWVWLDRVGLVLFDAGLSTGLFLSLVMLSMLVCRQPSRRLLLVRSALVASLAMVPVVALAPLPRLDLLAIFAHADFLSPSSAFDASAGDRGLAEGTLSVASGQAFATAFQRDYASWAGRWLPRTLTLIILAVAATGAAWLLLGYWGVHWLLRQSQDPSPTTRAVYNELGPGGCKPRTRPLLRVSSRVQRPVLVGLVRTTILIPASYDHPTGNAEFLKLSLLHEIAHDEQSDPWFGTVASLAQSIWFFLPHVWWLRSQLMIDQEFMADNSAARRYGTPSGYAASLLSLADSRPSSPANDSPPIQNRMWSEGPAARSPLFQRMLMLLYCPFRVEQLPPRRWSWSLRLVVVVASLASACLCIRWPHAAALEPRHTADSRSLREPFCVADFVAYPLVFTPGGRSLSFHMPVALPSHFELTVEVLSSTGELANVYIAGHQLLGQHSCPTADPSSNPASLALSWHQVRLERDGKVLSLRIDGQKIQDFMNPDATSEWLTFEPVPRRPTHFRNLLVDW